MEVGTEISQKIRSAIKAKLMELGAYVDDELPDYIMVMVANKKNKTQMRTDLSLFLGANTDAFTTWLHGLLGKLQTITAETAKGKSEKSKSSKDKKKDKDGKAPKGESTKKAKKDKDKGRKRKTSHGSVDEASKAKAPTTADDQSKEVRDLPKNLNETEGALKKDSQKEISQSEANKLRQNEVEDNLPVAESNDAPVQDDFEDVRQLLVAVTPGDELAEELDAAEEEIALSHSAKKSKSSIHAPEEPKDLSQQTSVASSSISSDQERMKRKVPSSVVASVSRDHDEEYDPFNPAVGSVASVVKVTSRKPTVPPSMQANRALLVKAMSDAEKSISVKRKVAVARPINRQPSPPEYSPKRKRPVRPGERETPPPYIPSKKPTVQSGHSSESRERILSRNDVRHTLGREDSRKLTSASRKEELLRHSGTSRSAASSLLISKALAKATAPQPSSRVAGSVSDRSRAGDPQKVAYGREVKGDGKAGGVKNLQITARVGPMRAFPAKESPGEEDSHSSSSESDKPLQVTVPSQSSIKVYPNTEPRPITAVTRKPQSSGLPESRAAAVRDAREDIQAAKRGRVADRLGAQKSAASARGARVITKLAREAVQKQCHAAVLSVRKAPAVAAPRAKDSSPDSRVVRCDSQSPTNVEVREGTEEEVRRVERSDSEASDNKVVVEEQASPIVSRSLEADGLTVSARVEEKVGSDTEDVEDLSHMLESEDLDSHLLLLPEEEEPGKNEFTLDLDDEDLSHVVEEVTAEEVKGSASDSKSGIRFIVTLDGVDEAQFDDRVAGSSVPSVNLTAAALPVQPKPPPVVTLPPSTPLRPPPVAAVPQHLPQLSSTPAQLAVKPRPPKIQPFSISLRDSDDEHEEKIVTYVQAGDGGAAGNVASSTDRGEDLSAVQRARMQERCRFWPACAAGSECQYHHPTTHCKTFPNCKFGDKCLFIHPNCRFDSKCTRADCPFTHTSKRRLVPAPMPPPPHLYPRYSSTPQQAAPCHFFPNCFNRNCTFAHPKPCMYGAACKNPGCTFYHPVSVSPPVTTTLPDKDKLRWQAKPSPQPKVAKPVAPIVTSTPGTKV